MTPDGLCDSSFNQNGFLSISYGTESFERWGAIVVEEDKKILVGGFSEDSLLLCSFRDDGSIDSAFGNYGKVKDYFGGYGTGIADICIQDDAKVVAVGRGNNSHMVLRYNTAFSIGLNEPKSEIVSFNIYPNPTKDVLYIDFNSNFSTSTFELTNTIGELVMNEVLEDKNSRINIEKIPTGIYYYQIKNKTSTLKVGKLIKE